MLKLSHICAIAALTLASAPYLHASTCVTGTVTSYEGLGAGGCTITVSGVTLDFTTFTFATSQNGPTSGDNAGTIILTPTVSGGNAGFDITSTTAWDATATGVNDVDLGFVASVVGGADVLDNIYVSETGTAGAGSPAGSDIITETVCPGGSVPPGSCPSGGVSNGGDLQINGTSSTSTTETQSQTLNYSLTNSLSVDKDIQINGESGSGSDLTLVQNLVGTATPEPSTLGFLAIAFCALVGFKKYQQKKTA